MQQLTGLDSAFLYLETSNAPMQIGGVSIIDPQTPDGRLDLDRLRELLLSRIHTSRTFTQRLVEVPLKLGKPYWIEDESFDIDRHLERTQLPEPGGWKELCALMAWEFSQQMDRDKPLWELLLVEGLETVEGVPPGSVALISKIHHAAIDGVSGSDLMSALYDPSPEPRAVPAATPRESQNGLSKGKLLRKSGRNLLKVPKALSGTLGETVKGVVRSGAAWRFKKVELPPLPFTAPRSRLNSPVSQNRTWSAALLSLDRIKAIRHSVEATVNDVVLTVCAGALRRYLQDKDDLPEKPLVAMVPISVRSEDERGTMGNQVSAMLVSLATDLDDPLERLRVIHRGATDSKIHHQAVGARTLSDYSQFIPFGLAGAGARLYTRMHLAEKHRPIFNLVITNVPGPQIPLYVAGARLLAHAGAAPIFDGMGLILPIFSYAGNLAVGATSCREIMPDIDVLTGYLVDSLNELEARVAEIDDADESV
ncbi:MAG: wax ester/triacylglycerol synthase family O-acyltransferase [Acidobacteriota bacterium]